MPCGNEKINNTSSLIKDYGCLITCFAMLCDKEICEMSASMTKNGEFQSGDRGAYAATFNVKGLRGQFLEASPLYPNSNVPVDKLITHLKDIGPAIIKVDISLAPGLQEHFVLATTTNGQDIFINDPWTGTQEKLTKYGKTNSEAIYQIIYYSGDFQPSQEKEMVTTVNLFVRDAPVSGNKIGLVPSGRKVSVLSSSNGWALVRINRSVGDSPISSSSGYMSLDYLSEDKSITPPPAPDIKLPKQLLGVHCISDYSAANNAAQNGCSLITVLDNKDAARQLKSKYPNTQVIYRAWMNFNPTVEQTINRLAISPNDPPFIFVGRNENDNGIGDDYEGLKQRAEYDKQVALAIKVLSPKSLYLAGSFSTGSIDITKPEIVNALQSFYSESYNNGLFGWDWHNYTTTAQLGQVDSKWYETRYEWLFTSCGFNPAVRNIWASETGMDIGGVGGFNQLNLTEEQFENWIIYYQKLVSRPITINGKSYQSPYCGGTIYQYGENNSWRGYDIRRYISVLKKYWG